MENKQISHGTEKKNSKKKILLWGCGGLLVAFIILAVLFTACSAAFINSVDESVNGTKEEKEKNKKTSEKRHKVGDEVTIKDVKFKLIDASYTDERNEFAEVKADKVLLVDMEMTNDGKKDIPIGTDVKAYADGKELETYPVSDSLLGSLSPGRTKQSKSAFAITGDPKKLELEFSPFADFSGTKAIYDLDPK